MKASWTLALGLVLGILSAVLMNLYISDLERSLVSQPFLRLKSEIAVAKGEIITPSMLEPVGLPEKFANLRSIAVPANAQSSTLLASGKGIATTDIQAGSFLLYEHIVQSPTASFASMIEAGKRAISIPVNSISAVSYFIGPGAYVDILTTLEITGVVVANVERTGSPSSSDQPVSSMNSSTPKIVTRTLLQNIKVLAVGSSVSAGNNVDGADAYSTVTFEVTPTEAEILTFALSQATGGLSLVLRNPANTEAIDVPDVSWEELIGTP